MRRKMYVVVLVVFVFCFAFSNTAFASERVTATLPTFPVLLNGEEISNDYNAYPLLVYKDITYFPMTYHYANFLGLRTAWENNTLSITKTATTAAYVRQYETKTANADKVSAAIAPIKVVVNGKEIQNDVEPYPLLFYGDVTYFPLTWRFAVEEFGWSYTFDHAQGLRINSTFVPPKAESTRNGDLYITDGAVAIGYPQNTFNENDLFSYWNGDKLQQQFSLQQDLSDGIYYFNCQATATGDIRFDADCPAVIKGDLLLLPAVRVNDETGEKENLMLQIDYVKASLVQKIYQ